MSHPSQVVIASDDVSVSLSREMLTHFYRELRSIAHAYLRQERRDHTLQATALVHEAFLRMSHGDERGQVWQNRRHFFAAASETMRRILIESVRRRKSRKRGGGYQRVEPMELDELEIDHGHARDDRLVALDDALEDLQTTDPLKADLVKLRFFIGMNQGEAAECLGISRRTADRHWAFARAWLLDRIQARDGD